ncbi:hypothetical protein CE561_09915 [Thermoanaerobacterium thermosaccharolyticum]|uniref:galactosylceramidase n=1 Tax=Thermoanaerobacterium thermosaccharolyticum TaxID=1517 RepID=A0A231VEZ7_THETR|nr:S-layer homology domain-containing protein [Thermoanaerobacterium thermosaccharolyticum]OXT06732.1 hypothetical protein CE561_09915 [Thermoanaerobacterium thermosaccharolyticum]
MNCKLEKTVSYIMTIIFSMTFVFFNEAFAMTNNNNVNTTISSAADNTDVLLEDDFQECVAGSNNVVGWNLIGGTWTVKEDTTTNNVYLSNSSNSEVFAIAGDTSWTDYSVEADVQLNGNGTAYPGILARYTDNTHYYMFRLDPTNLSTLELSKNIGSTSGIILASKSFPTTINKWYNLKMELRGNSIKCYVDGTLVFDVQDSSLSSGKIGFRAKWGPISIDNFVVRDLRYFSDDFEGTFSTAWTVDSGNWSVIKEVYNEMNYVYQQNDNSVEGIVINNNTKNLEDYSVQSDFMVITPNTKGGIIVREQDKNNYYLFRLNLINPQQAELIKVANGIPILLGSYSCTLELYKWYKIRIELMGSKILCYLNGNKVIEVKDTTYASGPMGLWTESGIADFDNVAVGPMTDTTKIPKIVNVDGSKEGRTFEGIGLVSANGSSRLLMDYPPEQQQDILNLLFKPNYGASLQHLKVEIGSDANSSSGTEPSHMRTENDFDITRGAGLWLASKAKAINPDIYLDALRWGTPSWIKTDEQKLEYYLKFLQGAKDVWGLNFDYLGADQNEGSFDSNWVTNVLRPGLDSAGFSNVKLVADDSVSNPWGIASTIKNNQALKNAIDVLSAHYTSNSTTDAQNSGKPLWYSEGRPQMRAYSLEDPNGPLQDMAKQIISSYVNGKMVKFEMQPFFESYYNIVPYNTKGNLIADKPWSGYYEIPVGFWITAQFTQFIKPGWIYLDDGCASDSRYNYLTLKKPDKSGDYSIIIDNVTSDPETFQFNLTGGLSNGTVHVWKTTEYVQFEKQQDIIPTVTDSSVTFTVTVDPYSITSLTTTTGQQKGQPKYAIPQDTNLVLPYADNFDNYQLGKEPKYATDEGGAFEVSNGGENGSKCLEQVITEQIKPIDWGSRTTPDPYTILGDLEWSNYSVSCDVNLENPQMSDPTKGYVALGGRTSDATSNTDIAQCYNIKLMQNGDWELRKGMSVLESGTLADFDPSKWYNLKLSFEYNNIKAYINGKIVADYNDTIGAIISGNVLLGSGYHIAKFDNLVVEPISDTIPIYVKRIDDSDSNILYQGKWNKTVDSYTNWNRTLTVFNPNTSVNDNTLGNGLNQFEYVGTWSYGSQSGAYQSDNHWSSVIDSYYQVRFQGTQIRLYGALDKVHGIAGVSIDGSPETLVDFYSPQRVDQALVYTSPVLEAGTHILKVRVTGTKNNNSTGTVITADRVDIVDNTQSPTENYLEYSFSGTGINIVGITGTTTVEADVYIDGQLKDSINEVPDFQGTKKLIYGISGLVPENHTIKFVPKTPISVDALEIYGLPPISYSRTGASTTTSGSSSNTSNTIGVVIKNGNIITLTLDAGKAKDLIVNSKDKEVVFDITTIGQGQQKVVQISKDILDTSAANGKEIVIKSDNASIALTKDALNQDQIQNGVNVSIKDNGKPNVTNYVPLSNVVDITISGSSGNVALVKPVEVTLNISKANDPRKVAVYYYNPTTNQWEYVGGKVDAASGTITFNATHFSQYAAFEYDKTFNDIKDNWAKDVIEVLASRHIVEGMADTQYEPNKTVTRAEFTAMILRLLNIKEEQYSGEFSDVKSGDWYANAIEAAYKAGLIEGDGKNARPNDSITREEMTAIAIRAYEMLTQYKEENLGATSFSDDKSISDWARNVVANAAKLGIVNGEPNNVFAPKGNATRAEAAAIIYGLLEKI